MPIKIPAFFIKLPLWLQWLFISVLALILFAPVLSNTFVSDDYIVLKKVCVDKQLNTIGFFRPLSDITLYINFLINDFHPAGYYLWNILVHALDTLLLFHFCRLWKWTDNEKMQLLTAGIAALLFLTYPFHSEPIVWVLGRASLMGNTFGMLALVFMVSNLKEPYKITGAAICYFIGMAGYESVMVLPAMVFVWLLSASASLKKYLVWMGAMTFTLVLHMIVRVNVSGTVTGEYGAGFFRWGVVGILAKMGKVLERLFLPPLQSTPVIFVLFLLLVPVVCILLIGVWKKLKGNKKQVVFLLQLAALLGISLLIPFLFGVSTHTSESDRFLHFPSFFFCALMGFVLVNLFNNKRALPVIVTAIVVYNIYFLETTNNNWRKASVAVRSLLNIVRDQTGKGELYIVNLPEEIDGAFVFRTGFKEALLINKLDTSKVTVVNQVKRDSLIKLPDIIVPEPVNGHVFIPPRVLINKGLPPQPLHEKKEDVITISPAPGELMVYWNKKNWLTL